MPLFNLQLAAHMDVGGPKSLSSYRGKTTYNYLHRLLFPPLFSVCRRRRLFDKNFLKKKVIQFVLKKIVVKVSWLFCKSGENSLFPLS